MFYSCLLLQRLNFSVQEVLLASVFFSNPILNYIYDVDENMCLISDFCSCHPHINQNWVFFKITNDISFLNCIIFQNQCTLILICSSPARAPCSAYQTCLSQASIYSFRGTTEFNHLYLNTHTKEY